jgi:hypothetical protein
MKKYNVESLNLSTIERPKILRIPTVLLLSLFMRRSCCSSAHTLPTLPTLSLYHDDSCQQLVRGLRRALLRSRHHVHRLRRNTRAHARRRRISNARGTRFGLCSIA